MNKQLGKLLFALPFMIAALIGGAVIARYHLPFYYFIIGFFVFMAASGLVRVTVNKSLHLRRAARLAAENARSITTPPEKK